MTAPVISTPGVWTPYSTASPMFAALPSWVTGQDQQRLAAYTLYEQIYWNAPDAFAATWRGVPDRPVYIPSGRTIVEACNRFLAKNFDFTILSAYGNPAQQTELRAAMTSLFVREKMYSKFNTQKRFGLIRGDAVWHVTADPNKQPGSRISIYEVDPASYFPIEDPNNPDRFTGVHLIEQLSQGSTTFIKRQTYRKVATPGGNQITSELAYFEITGWDDRDATQTLKPLNNLGIIGADAHPEILLNGISAIPVYHVKNFRAAADPFGSSEMRGLERLMASVNQTLSDEELSLALEGLGVYTTSSGTPVNSNGQDIDWVIAPGKVIQNVADFKRVQGVGSVTPSQDHADALIKSMREASGTPDIAVGQVDVSAVSSGIALQLQLQPVLAKNSEKEQEILGTLDHMLFDISTMWLPIYEGVNSGGVAQAGVIVGEAVPLDRATVISEVTQLVASGLASKAWAVPYLNEKLGYNFPADMLETLVSEATTAATISTDPFGARIDAETANAPAANPTTTTPGVTNG